VGRRRDCKGVREGVAGLTGLDSKGEGESAQEEAFKNEIFTAEGLERKLYKKKKGCGRRES